MFYLKCTGRANLIFVNLLCRIINFGTDFAINQSINSFFCYFLCRQV